MDAKSKANFINSIASEQEVICEGCGTKNQGDSKFCMTCGHKLAPAESTESAPAFAPAAEPAPAATSTESVPAFAPAKDPAPVSEATPAFAPVKPAQKAEQIEEPISAFAEGLPSWSIEPPQIMVRRRR